MHRSIGIIFAGVFLAFTSKVPGTPAEVHTTTGSQSFVRAASSGSTSSAQVNPNAAGPAAAQDVAAVLAAARGVSPLICAFAAQAVWGGGWGGWYDAPSSPVASEMTTRIRDLEREKFGAADVRLLLDSLASGDPCVRELSVRLLGRQRDEMVVNGLVERLTARAPELREVAALGLGFVEPKSAVDPLVRALRDATPGVRANSAWALGRIEDAPSAASARGSVAG